ncbi:hypothetical protein J3Q64DRAFT_1810096 [Phycomyces blakesleeanus]|uniref:Uncharacterized protein n=1 Tax=Phycomyces blakesleeanus TaxID=4837 RepID=A0ABR3AV38_PHYBL
MSRQEIYSKMIFITDLFDDKMAKRNYASVEQQRIYQNTEHKTRRRLLCVLKKGHRGKEDASTRSRLLDLMVDRLIKNSSVNTVFASYSSTSKQPFADSDKTNPIHVPKTPGNTQDLSRLFSTARKAVWDHEIVMIVLIENIETLTQ